MSPTAAVAAELLKRLCAQLAAITGSTGEASFDIADMAQPRSVFLVAFMDGQPVGCGALRPIDEITCEVKRMYSIRPRGGVGALVLAELERRAKADGYERVVMETRRVNDAGVQFYLKHGYAVIPNYGKYVSRPEAICFGKPL